MKVHLTDHAPGESGSLLVAEVEFSSKARRVRVESSDGLEALDLRGERAGGLYDAAPSLDRLHVPLRVTKSGSRTAKVRVTVEDAGGTIPPEAWEGAVRLDAPPSRTGSVVLVLAGFAGVVAALLWLVVLPILKKTSVPSVEGRTVADAESVLKKVGYTPIVQYEDDPAHAGDAGIVFQQTPTGPQPRNSPILLRAGRPAAGVSVTVPNLVGHPLADVEAAFGEIGLHVTSHSEDADEAQDGKVLRTSPEPGAHVTSGSSVEVVVGHRRGPALHDVPDVVGSSRADAEAALTKAGFAPSFVEQDAVTSETVGRVVAQTPSAGAKVAESSAVELTIGRQPKIAEIPDVLGRLQAEAERAIADAGFVAEVVVAEPSSGPAGRVLSQEPSASTARQGTHVTLRVPRAADGATPVRPPPSANPVTNPAAHPPTNPPSVAAPSSAVPAHPPGTGPRPAIPSSLPPSTATPTGPSPKGPSPTGPSPMGPTPTAPTVAANPTPTGPTKPPAAPDLIGLSRAAAETELKKIGLEARVWDEEGPPDTPEGIVLRQVPSASEPVLGGAVEITVSKRAGGPASTPSVATNPAPTNPTPTNPVPPNPTVPPNPNNPTPTPNTPSHPPLALPTPGNPLIAPDVVGLSESDARARLVDAGLEFRIDYEDSTTARAGTVVRQSPPPQFAVAAGIRVVMTVARAVAVVPGVPTNPPTSFPPIPPPAIPSTPTPAGPNPVNPTPVNPPWPQPPPSPATDGSGLPPPRRGHGAVLPPSTYPPANPTVPSTTPTYPPYAPTPPPASSPEVPPANVPSSSAPVPPPASLVQPGPSAPLASASLPMVMLGGAAQTVTVPDFSGRDATAAVETALRVGLLPTFVPESDARASAGRVGSQTPAAGTAAQTGSTVTLGVGPGSSPQTVDVPNVVGLSSAEAASRLSRAGFKAQLATAGAKPGVFALGTQVVAQTPVGRVSADQARVVRIYLP